MTLIHNFITPSGPGLTGSAELSKLRKQRDSFVPLSRRFFAGRTASSCEQPCLHRGVMTGPTCPPPRHAHCAWMMGHYMYIFGGMGFEGLGSARAFGHGDEMSTRGSAFTQQHGSCNINHSITQIRCIVDCHELFL